MSTRWKYKTAVVKAGENTLNVRQLTQSERLKLVSLTKEVTEGKQDLLMVTEFVAKSGVTDDLSDEDLKTMPPELIDACADKILELSELKTEEGKSKNAVPTAS